jgi:hypothetical protein
VFGLKPKTPLICAVEQLAYYLENLNLRIVIKVDSHFLDDVTRAFENTPIKEGSNNLYRKIPWDEYRRKTPKYRGMCRYYFSAPHP